MATSARKSLSKMSMVLHVRYTRRSWYIFLAALFKTIMVTKFQVLQQMTSFDFVIAFFLTGRCHFELQDAIEVSVTPLLPTVKFDKNTCRPLVKCADFYWLCCFLSFCLTSLLVCSPLPFTLVSSVSRLIQMRKKFRLLSSSYSRWAPPDSKLGTKHNSWKCLTSDNFFHFIQKLFNFLIYNVTVTVSLIWFFC